MLICFYQQLLKTVIRQYESEKTYRKGQRSIKEFEIQLEEVHLFGYLFYFFEVVGTRVNIDLIVPVTCIDLQYEVAIHAK